MAKEWRTNTVPKSNQKHIHRHIVLAESMANVYAF